MSKDNKDHKQHGHSGGMGGVKGGPLHDVGSAQSGQIGGMGSGGKTADAIPGGSEQSARQDSQQSGRPNEQADVDDDLIGGEEGSDLQQSAQRQGMGRNQGSGNRN